MSETTASVDQFWGDRVHKRVFVLSEDLSGLNTYLLKALSDCGWSATSVDKGYFSAFEYYISAAIGFHWDKREWKRRFHQELGRRSKSAQGILAKTRRCSKLIAANAQRGDIVFSFTLFEPSALEWDGPYVVFKDYTMALARRTYPPVLDVAGAELERRMELEADFCRYAAHVFTASDNTRRSLIEDYGIAPAQVSAVGEGLCLPSVPPPRTANEPFAKNILFVGKEFERKGGKALLEAIEIIRSKHPDATLSILGPDRPQQIPAGVDWVGFVADRSVVQEYFRKASVFAMPSLCEPFGLVFLEAMAFGLPCIGSAQDAMPEIIQDGVTGFLVPAGDSANLANRTIQLLDDPQLAASMGRAGYERLVSRYTWEHVGARIDRVLTGLLQ